MFSPGTNVSHLQSLRGICSPVAELGFASEDADLGHYEPEPELNTSNTSTLPTAAHVLSLDSNLKPTFPLGQQGTPNRNQA